MTKAQLQAEITRLKAKCDRQAILLQRIYVEHNPGVYFIAGEGGEKDRNGMPERIHVCPAYGCDWSMVYHRSGGAISA